MRQLTSGQPNEVWSFGGELEKILTSYLFVRERLRPYVRSLMQAAHETGAPVMRPLMYDFPNDPAAWSVEDSYMFGPDLLISPVMEPGATERTLYLPTGETWTDAHTGRQYQGGQTITVPAPLEIIPVMVRGEKKIRVW